MMKLLPSRHMGVHRSLRSLNPTATSESAAMVDQHGFALFLLAHVLTSDPEHAERLVVQAITAQGETVCEFRELAAAVHIAWSAWGPLSPTPEHSGARSSDAQVMDDLHALPEDQRAAVALCRYGDHTYREAADLLGIPAEEMAVLLGVALRALATPGTRAEPSPSAFFAS